jgi:hypothetical protein
MHACNNSKNERFRTDQVCLEKRRREKGKKKKKKKKKAPLFIRSFRRGQKRRRELNMMMRMIHGCTQNAKMPTPERFEIPKITV